MTQYGAAALALLVSLIPSSLAAQQPVQFTVSGFGGAYIPASDLFDELFTEGALRFGQETSFTLGGRFAVWPIPRLGIEAEGAFTGSDVEFKGVLDATPFDTTLSANVFYGSINVIYALIRPPFEPLAIYVSGGIGLVARGGFFFDEFFQLIIDPRFETETTNVAGVVGFGIRYGISPLLNIRGDFKDYISSNRPFAGLDSKLQNDLLITVALEFVFGGR